MKRLLLPSLCALLSLATLNSCQQEEKSSLELAKQLTEELQTVVDKSTADAAAPRVAAMNKRFQDASIQTAAANGTPLLQSANRPDEYADALAELSRQMGRISASLPVLEYDANVDKDQLLITLGKAKTKDGETLSDEEALAAGKAYMSNSIDKTRESTGELPAYYGSAALEEALSYTADPSTASLFSMGEAVEETPEAAIPADEEEEEGEE